MSQIDAPKVSRVFRQAPTLPVRASRLNRFAARTAGVIGLLLILLPWAIDVGPLSLPGPLRSPAAMSPLPLLGLLLCTGSVLWQCGD